MSDVEKEDLRAYRPGRLSILQLMFVLAMLGVIATLALRYLFTM